MHLGGIMFCEYGADGWGRLLDTLNRAFDMLRGGAVISASAQETFRAGRGNPSVECACGPVGAGGAVPGDQHGMPAWAPVLPVAG